jgi:hypothetical protein
MQLDMDADQKAAVQRILNAKKKNVRLCTTASSRRAANACCGSQDLKGLLVAQREGRLEQYLRADLERAGIDLSPTAKSTPVRVPGASSPTTSPRSPEHTQSVTSLTPRKPSATERIFSQSMPPPTGPALSRDALLSSSRASTSALNLSQSMAPATSPPRESTKSRAVSARAGSVLEESASAHDVNMRLLRQSEREANLVGTPLGAGTKAASRDDEVDEEPKVHENPLFAKPKRSKPHRGSLPVSPELSPERIVPPSHKSYTSGDSSFSVESPTDLDAHELQAAIVSPRRPHRASAPEESHINDVLSYTGPSHGHNIARVMGMPTKGVTSNLLKTARRPSSGSTPSRSTSMRTTLYAEGAVGLSPRASDRTVGLSSHSLSSLATAQRSKSSRLSTSFQDPYHESGIMAHASKQESRARALSRTERETIRAQTQERILRQMASECEAKHPELKDTVQKQASVNETATVIAGAESPYCGCNPLGCSPEYVVEEDEENTGCILFGSSWLSCVPYLWSTGPRSSSTTATSRITLD